MQPSEADEGKKQVWIGLDFRTEKSERHALGLAPVHSRGPLL